MYDTPLSRHTADRLGGADKPPPFEDHWANSGTAPADAISHLEAGLRELAGMLSQANHQVEVYANRLFGARPTDGSKEDYASDPYTIQDWVNHNRMEAERLLQQLSRFS